MIENYGILGWIVIGLLAGGIAKLLMPGKDPGGCLITILLGIAGALLAGFLGKAVGWYDEGEGGRLHRRDRRRLPDPAGLPAGAAPPRIAATCAVHIRAIAAGQRCGGGPFCW